MTYAKDEAGGSNNGDGGDGFHRMQAECVESNWEFNLAQKVEEYLVEATTTIEADFIECD
ncbi:condensin-2 complex subunit H2 [Pyrus ussuriensis x Pyrus communis]|uniref:Condensin-2 complex subunit H2 n=1 Tax=Pyrus ussuriensis x Pyrus communis TaxID=2448454 RepID=A0A5N5G812_9ROSA|nr:condensin-2 complex subunit H2 [Pyrus ussuriensis x Pyrus communis]